MLLNEEIIDLTAKFSENLQKGEHHIYNSDGINLFVTLKDGKFIWHANDNHGDKLEVSTSFNPPKCEKLVKQRDGTWRSFMVPCSVIMNEAN